MPHKSRFKDLKNSILRKRFKNIRFSSGTITWKECLIILVSIFNGRNIVEGKYIKKYESEVSKYLGAKYAYSFGAGRMAFYAILKALGISEGDEVILPGYTCVVVPNAIIYCGAKPVYVDIEPDTLNIDVKKIETKITSKTKVIYAQHTFGTFCNMDAITKIAKKYNLKIVEDCAHALGAEYNGKKAGTFGDAAYFTTEQSKLISTGMGGFAVTNDEKIALRLQKIQGESEYHNEKIIRRIALQIVLYKVLFYPPIYFIGKYIIYILNRSNFFIVSTTEDELRGDKPEQYPIRLSNLQAQIGLNQLKNIELNLNHRRELANFYRESLQKLNYKIPERNDVKYKSSYIRYWFIVNDREKLKNIFNNEGIELGEWFNNPIHPKGSFLKNIHYEQGCCPVAEYMANHNVNLPTHPNVSFADAEWIIEVLRNYEET